MNYTMKLTDHGYVLRKDEFSTREIQDIKQDLTVKPFVMNTFNQGNEIKFTTYLESPHKLYLPRFYGQQKWGIPSKITLGGEKINLQFKGSLRKEQQPIYDICMKQLQSIGGGILSLKCGGGKTILSLYVASQLNYKTIVVVHKDFLMTQWYDRIREFIPKAKIGKFNNPL